MAAVTFAPYAQAEKYWQDLGFPWPLLLDENRELYRGYGMYRAGFWDIWGPRTWLAYLKELSHGNLPKNISGSGDIHQQGGDVLIDDQGIVRLHHVGSGSSDRPPVQAILRHSGTFA